MPQQSKELMYFSPTARALYFVLAVATVVIGQGWIYLHPIELAMDIVAPLPFVFLALARRPPGIFVKLGFASVLVLIATMVAAAKWMTVPA